MLCEQASKQCSSIASSSVPASWFLSGFPIMMKSLNEINLNLPKVAFSHGVYHMRTYYMCPKNRVAFKCPLDMAL